jgi:tetratricopeptide (TPR) repeat protein
MAGLLGGDLASLGKPSVASVGSASSRIAWWASPWVGAACIMAAAAAAYWTSFDGVFVFDDVQAIVENPTIRGLSGQAFSPPAGGLTVSGRPVLNFSFALNHAISGLTPWSYHAVNLMIHALAGVVLLGVVRRTLRSPLVGKGWHDDALLVALGVALLWTVHPLQTQAVTYVVQRAESLMGLWYLLTLYCFARGAEATDVRREKRWFALAVGACLLGMGTKEVMVTAPLMIFLYDRTFIAGSFAEAWRRRWPVHVALAATWLLLAWLVFGNSGGTRGGTAGFGSAGWGSYVPTQFEAVTRYLALAIWPHPLVFEYGVMRGASAAQVLPWVPGILALAAGTVWALWRRPAAGFLGAWFLGILATTSLVPGVHQMIVEHRMYLSLAAVLVAAVLGLRAVMGRQAWWVTGLLVVAGTAFTARRNLEYHSVIGIWADTVAKRPGNTNARNNLGNALADAGRLEEAVAQYAAALALNPAMPDAHYNLGLSLLALGRPAEALPTLQEALRLQPGYVAAQATLGDALTDLGRFAEAIPHYESVLRVHPDDADAHNNLGVALGQLDRVAEARRHFAEALRLRPDFPTARANLEAMGR